MKAGAAGQTIRLKSHADLRRFEVQDVRPWLDEAQAVGDGPIWFGVIVFDFAQPTHPPDRRHHQVMPWHATTL